MLEETLTWSDLLFWENPELGREEQNLGQDKAALPSPKVFCESQRYLEQVTHRPNVLLEPL